MNGTAPLKRSKKQKVQQHTFEDDISLGKETIEPKDVSPKGKVQKSKKGKVQKEKKGIATSIKGILRFRSKEKDEKGEKGEKGEKIEKDCGDPVICGAVKKLEESIRSKIGKESLDEYFNENLKSFTPQKTTADVFFTSENKMKNRSPFPCYDHSRVKLDRINDKKTDFINANLVEFEDIGRKYIMTQYPLPETMEDFWAMAFENEVELILSIFNPIGDPDIEEYMSKIDNKSAMPETKILTSRENSFAMNKSQAEIAIKSKRCSVRDSLSYFPLHEGEYMTIGRFFIHTRKVEVHSNPIRPTSYTIEVLPEGCSECKFIRVVNCPKWEKKKIVEAKSVISLIRAIDLDELRKGPIVVHCDTGTDRSACLVMADVISKKVFVGKNVEIDEIFKKIRNSRAGTLQSSRHFVLSIYVAVYYIGIRCNTKKMLNEQTNKILDKLIGDLEKMKLSCESG